MTCTPPCLLLQHFSSPRKAAWLGSYSKGFRIRQNLKGQIQALPALWPQASCSSSVSPSFLNRRPEKTLFPHRQDIVSFIKPAGIDGGNMPTREHSHPYSRIFPYLLKATLYPLTLPFSLYGQFVHRLLWAHKILSLSTSRTKRSGNESDPSAIAQPSNLSRI